MLGTAGGALVFFDSLTTAQQHQDLLHNDHIGKLILACVKNALADEDELVSAYKENHEIVFPHVSDLLEELGGRSVVTSDHGKLLGDRTYVFPVQGFSHSSGITYEKLVVSQSGLEFSSN